MNCFSTLPSSPILFAVGTAFILLSVYGTAAAIIRNKNIVITSVVKVFRGADGTYLAEFNCGKTLRAAEYQILELQTNPYGVLVHDRKQILFFYAAHTEQQASERLTREQKRSRHCRLLSLLTAAAIPLLGSGLVSALLSAAADSSLHKVGILALLLLPTACCFAHDCILKAAGLFREHAEVTLAHLVLLTALLFCQDLIMLYKLGTVSTTLGIGSILFLCLPIGISAYTVQKKI